MKGRTAAAELAAERAELTRLGMVSAVISEHGGRLLEEPTVTLDLTVRRPRRRRKAQYQRRS
jgi:16S rRNA (guanine527-N7)-methyltransferase